MIDGEDMAVLPASSKASRGGSGKQGFYSKASLCSDSHEAWRDMVDSRNWPASRTSRNKRSHCLHCISLVSLQQVRRLDLVQIKFLHL